MLKGSSPIKESSEVTGGLIGSQSPVRYDKLTSPSQREREEPAAGAKWWKAKVVGALALVVVVVVVVTVVVVVPDHGHSKTAAAVGTGASQPSPAENMISVACNSTTYPDSCRSSLSAYPGASTASVKDLVMIGLQIANRDVSPGWQAALTFLRGQQAGGSQLFVDAVDDCTEMMGNCLDSLNGSISTFQNLSADKEAFDTQINDIKTYMSDTLTEIDSCSQSLEETDQKACDGFNALAKTFKEELSTALGLVNYWYESLDSTSGHNRRLLSLSRSGLFSIIGSDSSNEAVVQPVLQTDQKADVAVPGSRSAVRCVLNCFRADPVCGEDGVTYWCGTADAKCAGVGVAHAGFCNIENGGAGGKGSRAVQSLLLVHLVWLFLAGLLVLIELP